MASTASVQTGLWTNHQYNSVEGATLTMTTTNASYLVAFLALFLGIVASHFWAIISYTVFQIRSTLASRDGQHHQQQAILRNYHAPGAAIWQLFLVSWSWRQRRGLRALLPALPVVVLALISVSAFAAAGILSARVTSKESDVLIKSSQCGFWNEQDSATQPGVFAEQRGWAANLAEDFHLASTMAAACQKNSSIASDCISYAPKQIEWTTSTDISCPFDKKICYQNKAVRFDTGLLDTTVYFGINAPRDDRLLLRHVVECSPLVQEGYVSDWHDMNGTKFAPGNLNGDVLVTRPGEQWLEWYYGPDGQFGLNSTFIYSDLEPSAHMFGSQLFALAGRRARLDSTKSNGFLPISELKLADADLNLLFLRQEMGLQYAKPVNDPWFEAKWPLPWEYNVAVNDFKNVTVYGPKFPISTVGCAMQYQWCDPSTGPNATCTELTGFTRSVRQADKMIKPEKQRVTLKRMRDILVSSGDFLNIITAITGSVLLINKFGYFQMAAPKDDQWIQELSHMFGTLLTNMQIRNYRFTGGYTSAMNVDPVIQPPVANETWMCDAQLVRRSDYQSLSVLGLALICGLGSLIVVINLSLDSIVGWYQKRYKKREYATHEWELLEAETLQKQLYKSHGMDLREEDVSVASVLERMKTRRYGETIDTLVEREQRGMKELKSMSSAGTLGKGSAVDVRVRRASTEMTLPVSPLTRKNSI